MEARSVAEHNFLAPGFLCFPLPLCSFAVRNHHCPSKWNSVTNHYTEKGSWNHPGILRIFETQVTKTSWTYHFHLESAAYWDKRMPGIFFMFWNSTLRWIVDHITNLYGYFFNLNIFRLDTNTMFKVREWERFQFGIDYQHQQVCQHLHNFNLFVQNLIPVWFKHKKILERTIPDSLKLSIAKTIENNLFSKVHFCSASF